MNNPKTPKDTTQLEQLDELLKKMNLEYAADYLAELMSEAAAQDIPPHRFLLKLLQTEHQRREERRIKTSLRLSGLPLGQTFANFDFSFQPGIERSRIETLATCAFLRAGESVLFQGPPGVGKTHLAVALGIRAVELGFSVAFFRLDDLLHAMKKDAGTSPHRLKGKKYMKVALLLIDEVGFQPMTREEASLFFRMVSYRYQKGSTLITTNKSIKDWPEIFANDEVMTTALLDRLLHRCHVFNIKGRSYRLKELERESKP